MDILCNPCTFMCDILGRSITFWHQTRRPQGLICSKSRHCHAGRVIILLSHRLRAYLVYRERNDTGKRLTRSSGIHKARAICTFNSESPLQSFTEFLLHMFDSVAYPKSPGLAWLIHHFDPNGRYLIRTLCTFWYAYVCHVWSLRSSGVSYW
jgi:hypothetical protein